MNLVKQKSDNLIAIGVCGNTHEQTLWKNFIHNYSVTRGKFYSVSNHFGYFLADRQKLESALALMFCHEAFLKKEISASDCEEGKNRWGYRKKAREFIENIPEETFYTHLLSPTDAYKEWNIRFQSLDTRRAKQEDCFDNLFTGSHFTSSETSS